MSDYNVIDIYGDALEIFSAELDAVLIHQANCAHTMGAGIALQIARKFPQAVTADRATPLSDSKLGSYSLANTPFNNGLIANVYGQAGFSRTTRCTSYDALYDGVCSLCGTLLENVLRTSAPVPSSLIVPHGIGCGLGGGEWSIVRPIIIDATSGLRDIGAILKIVKLYERD